MDFTGKSMLVGDFNIHVCRLTNPLVGAFLNVIDSFNLIQHVHKPTDVHGHILDLVL